MKLATESENQDGNPVNITQKLMVNGFVCLPNNCAISIEVRRGMSIRSKEGLMVGKVAAVVLNNEISKATHILLSRLPEINGYWLVPVDFISRANAEEIQLAIPDTAIEFLPRWHSP